MNSYTVPALDRMNSILSYLEVEPEGKTLVEIVDFTGIAKTTALRLLSAMTRYGYLV